MQAIQETGLEPLVGIRADDPPRAEPGRFDKQAMAVAGLVRMRRSRAILREDRHDARLAAKDLARPVGRAVVQGDDAVYGISYVVEKAGQISLFISDGDQAEHRQSALRHARPMPPCATVEQHKPAGPAIRSLLQLQADSRPF
ncbi:MAG: hypothetical protein R3D05_03215 [Dongiaceae bacterium]